LQKEIVERLKILDPEKIVLFGSFAYGIPDEESDIDICIMKTIPKKNARSTSLQARKLLRDLISKYKTGFDIITVPESYAIERQDQFYMDDILTKGKVIYAK